MPKPIRFKPKIKAAPDIRNKRNTIATIPITWPIAEAPFFLPMADFILFKFSFNIFLLILSEDVSGDANCYEEDY